MNYLLYIYKVQDKPLPLDNELIYALAVMADHFCNNLLVYMGNDDIANFFDDIFK